MKRRVITVSREELIQMIADRHIFKGVVPDESWYEDLANDIEAEIKKARVEVANKALYESDIDCTECVHVGERDLCTKSPECPCVEGYLKFIISANERSPEVSKTIDET